MDQRKENKLYKQKTSIDFVQQQWIRALYMNRDSPESERTYIIWYEYNMFAAV